VIKPKKERRTNMIKNRKERRGMLEVDLTGPDGNAFVLMGMAAKWAKQLGKDGKALLKEMQSGDYEHLFAVMEREFGERVIFYR
jgi:hypothetical protein